MAYVQQVTDRRRAELELIVARLEPGDRPAVCRALEAFVAVAGEPTVEALAVLGGG
jgi:hypothetical protein